MIYLIPFAFILVLIAYFAVGAIIAFILYIIFYIIYSYFILYHLQEFGYVGDASRPMSIVYITLSLTIIVGSVILLVITKGLYA